MTRLPKLLQWTLGIAIVTACVEPISFNTPPPIDIIVVDGMITDEAAPYVVRISRGRSLNVDTSYHYPVQGVNITLHDDTGAEEKFVEWQPGEYRTTGIIHGTVGHSYYITLGMPDGRMLRSEPEKILPRGEIKNVKYEYATRLETKSFALVESNYFNIILDSKANSEASESSFIRWRLTGTYKIDTSPHLHLTFLQTSAYMTPYPCSGYVVEPALGGGKLVQRSPCVCCTCWVRRYETKPQLSDTELVSDGEFRNVKVGEVPVNSETFHDKFQVEVQQMPISKTVFDFFKLIRIQKESGNNLFQPPSGKVIGNIKGEDDSYPVVGLFWATSITKHTFFLTRNDVPYNIVPMDVVPEPCLSWANSTTIKPASWE